MPRQRLVVNSLPRSRQITLLPFMALAVVGLMGVVSALSELSWPGSLLPGGVGLLFLLVAAVLGNNTLRRLPFAGGRRNIARYHFSLTHPVQITLAPIRAAGRALVQIDICHARDSFLGGREVPPIKVRLRGLRRSDLLADDTDLLAGRSYDSTHSLHFVEFPVRSDGPWTASIEITFPQPLPEDAMSRVLGRSESPMFIRLTLAGSCTQVSLPADLEFGAADDGPGFEVIVPARVQRAEPVQPGEEARPEP